MSQNIPKLKPIEQLVRERELSGYNVLRELLDVLTRASEVPGNHRVVMHGPDALFISRSRPAIDFLLDCGFVIAEPDPNMMLHLPHVFDDGSPEWEVLRKGMVQAAAMVQWAMECNSNLLTVQLNRMYVLKNFSAPFRVEISVKWRDELGKDQVEELAHYDYYDPDTAVPSPSKVDADTGRVKVGDGSGSHSMVTYHTLDEVFATHCDCKCTLEIRVLRKRVLADKLKAVATVKYDNFGIMKEDIDLHDPDHPHGLPVGNVSIEVGSLAHRCFLVEEAQRIALSPPVRIKQVEPDPQPQNHTSMEDDDATATTPDPARNLKMGGNTDGAKFDEDDYFGTP